VLDDVVGPMVTSGFEATDFGAREKGPTFWLDDIDFAVPAARTFSSPTIRCVSRNFQISSKIGAPFDAPHRLA